MSSLRDFYAQHPGARPPSEPIACRLPTDLYDAVEQYRQQNNLTKTQVIVQALTRFFDETTIN